MERGEEAAQRLLGTSTIPAGTTGSGEVLDLLDPVEAEVRVLEVERGDSVKRHLSGSEQQRQSYVDREVPSGYELLSVLMEVRVTQAENDRPVDFDYYFNIADENRLLCHKTVPGISINDPLENIYPGVTIKGRAVFIIDKNVREPVLRFSQTLFTPATWFELPEPVTSSAYDSPGDAEAPRRLGGMTDEQLRGLTFGAVLATRRDLSYDYLAGYDLGGWLSDWLVGLDQNMLETGWGITNRSEAVAMIDRLAAGLHHRPRPAEDFEGYDVIFDIAMGRRQASSEERILYSDRIAACDVVTNVLTGSYGYTIEELNRIKTVSAWDYDRLVTISRACYAVGWLSEQETWSYIEKAAAAGSSDYTSWREYFAGVMYGRAIWSRDASFSAENTIIANKLLNSDNSIYNTVPFRLVELV